MKKRIFKNRKTRYASVSVLLSLLLVCVIVLFNAVFSTLGERYGWYLNLNRRAEYPVSEKTYELLSSVLAGSEEPVEFLFCDTEEAWKEETTQRYVYESVCQLANRFEGKIKIKCADLFIDPTVFVPYLTEEDPVTGEKIDATLNQSDLIIHKGDYHRTYQLTEFFLSESGDTSSFWAYNGERKLASGILQAVHPSGKSVGMLKNHGEIFYDYEILYLFDDAGYEINYVDLYREEIPEDCTLLVSYNPNSDFTVADELSEYSEIEKLEAFLSGSGNALLVFLEKATPSLPNLENYLGEWGVDTCYHTQSDGISYRYAVQNQGESLTSDGATVMGVPANHETVVARFGSMPDHVIFKNATALRAANGFVNCGDGSYQKGDRTLYSVFGSGKNSVSYANGSPVDQSDVMFVTLTEQKNADDGKSYVGVVSSVEFATEAFLQSAVYGNTDTLLQICKGLGMYTPDGLPVRPFRSDNMSLVTTSEIRGWTVMLALVPAVLAIGVGTVLSIRRRNRK